MDPIQSPDIDLREVLLYLGWRGSVPEDELRASMEDCIRQVRKYAQPRVIWRRFPVKDTTIEGTSLCLEGEDIRRHLENCSEAVLMAATLGPGVEQLLMRTQVVDMARALIMDSCASAAIEAVCDQLEGQLRAQVEQEGRYLTDRFSPGYGDLPISHQRMFCEVLDTQRRMGLSVSESGILIPRKSVTAVLGVSDAPRTRRSSGCGRCNLFYRCEIRKGGRYCGK